MIKNSFIFLDKIGENGEFNLWKNKITNWQEFLAAKQIKGISSLRKEHYNRRLLQASRALQDEDYDYFVGKLPPKEMWRLYPQCRETCCFLDVEVDSAGSIILVGVSDYFHTNFFVKGINLTKKQLEKELDQYQLIITFNGSAFDLPKLTKQFAVSNKAHIDLKPLCASLGLTGGLKDIEKRLNLKRPPHLYGNPISLWKSFKASGDKEYLDLLIEYNREDVENLKLIIEWVYKNKSELLQRKVVSIK